MTWTAHLRYLWLYVVGSFGKKLLKLINLQETAGHNFITVGKVVIFLQQSFCL
jgi:hypothetical protein